MVCKVILWVKPKLQASHVKNILYIYERFIHVGLFACYKKAMLTPGFCRLHARTVGFKPQHIIDVEDTINGITDVGLQSLLYYLLVLIINAD